MTKKTFIFGFALLLMGALSAFGQAWEPDRVTVQHILIAFKGTIPDSKIERSKEETEVLVAEIYERARKGEDFDALVKQYTNDQYPGIYNLVNTGIELIASDKEFARGRMVKAFGDVSFGLRVGEIGLAPYDPETSKYGWHIIKRIR
jgi:parvulin-like peptidyl-prolyl isomerase